MFKLTRLEIQEAIKCKHWQSYRLSMKGLDTAEKLVKLKSYFNAEDSTFTEQRNKAAVICCDEETRRIQVINYLNALARGGQIFPVNQQYLEFGRIRVKRER